MALFPALSVVKLVQSLVFGFARKLRHGTSIQISTSWRQFILISGSILTILGGYTVLGTATLAYTLAYYYVPFVQQLTRILIYGLAGYGAYMLLV